jgi:hypothetical protein
MIMKKSFTTIAMLLGTLFVMKAADLPLDFETGTFEWTNFDGGEVTVIDNPQSSGINTSTKVAQMIKSAGQTWGGSYLTLDNPIDFSSDNTFTMKVFSPRTGAKVLLKVENADDGGIAYEREVETTLAGEWEELTFDYSLIDNTQSYQKVVIIFDNGTMGDGSADFTFLFDDIALSYEAPVLEAPALPFDFESANVDYTFNDFDGGAMTLIDNPQVSGINTSSKVAQMVKNAGQTWGGSWIALGDPIDLSISKMFSMKVFAPRTGAKVLLKLENASDGGIFMELEAETTVANEWEELMYDFSAIDESKSYQKLVFIIDNGTVGDGSANWTFLLDDVMQKTDNTSVKPGTSSAVSVYAVHGQLILKGLDDHIDGTVSVYDLTGREITSRRISESQATMEMEGKGIYIVRITDRSNRDVVSKKVYTY